jgi:hypothetical protein
LQELNPLLFGLMIRSALAPKGGSAILEELFLPTVENRWLQPQFITQIGNRHFKALVYCFSTKDDRPFH